MGGKTPCGQRAGAASRAGSLARDERVARLLVADGNDPYGSRSTLSALLKPQWGAGSCGAVYTTCT